MSDNELSALRARITTLEAIIRGAGEQLGQGEIPLAVAIARLQADLGLARRQRDTAAQERYALLRGNDDTLGRLRDLARACGVDTGTADIHQLIARLAEQVPAELDAARALAETLRTQMPAHRRAPGPAWQAIDQAMEAYEAAGKGAT